MKTRKLLQCGLFVLVLLVTAISAAAPTLTFKFSKANVPGALETILVGVNNAGMTSGEFVDTAGGLHGFILNAAGTKFTQLDDPKAVSFTAASNLNPGTPTMVVGSYGKNAQGASVGFLYKGGKYTDILGPKGATNSSANGINDAGAIVGSYTDSAGVTHGFLLKQGKYTILDVPGAVGVTAASGINNAGAIVVWYSKDSNGDSGSAMTINKGKTYKKLAVPGAGSGGDAAEDINDTNDVSFVYFDTAGRYHAALLHGGIYYKFNPFKSAESAAYGLNDKMTVAGSWSVRTNGVLHGYKGLYH